MSNLKVWTCKDHGGVWPVGACSVVVAESEEQAREMLTDLLKVALLKPGDFTLQPLDMSKPYAKILLDGDY